MRFWKSRKISQPPLVTMQVAVYLNQDPRQVMALRCLVASLQAQTYSRWEALLVHDGPVRHTAETRALLEDLAKEPRLQWYETPERKGHFGHEWRLWIVHKKAKGDVVGFTNQDGYYAPVYLEWMVSELLLRKAELVYCDMVHSHRLWSHLSTKPKRGHIDLGAFLTRMTLAKATPWTDTSFKGDGHYIGALARAAKRVVKVPGILYVHN